MGFHSWPDDFWRRTAPRPKDEASAEIFEQAWGLNKARTVGLANSHFTFSKAVCWLGSHSHDLFGLRSSQSGWLSCDRLGENFPN